MAVLTYAQMEGYWIKAGGPVAVAPVAAAIGEAESGGNTDAINPDDNHGTQSSYGVWQISNGTHTPPSANWADPATNASLAVAKYKGANNTFAPWGTYTTGAYTAYLSSSTTPDLNVQGNPGAIAAETTADVMADCLFGFSGVPGTSIFNDLFGSGGNVGQTCFITRSNARGWIGGLLLAAGVAGAALTLGLMIYLGGQENAFGAAAQRLVRSQAGASLDQQDAAQREADQQAAARQKAAQSQRAVPRPTPSQPSGRHAKTGANAPATGRHVRRP